MSLNVRFFVIEWADFWRIRIGINHGGFELCQDKGRRSIGEHS
jgi:hypothetical protein